MDSKNCIDTDTDEYIPHPALVLGYAPSKKFDSISDRIENSMCIIAALIVEEGDVYLPVFQRLEDELEAHKKREASLRRALKISGRS